MSARLCDSTWTDARGRVERSFPELALANAAEVMSEPHITTQVVVVALSVFAFWFAYWSASREIFR